MQCFIHRLAERGIDFATVAPQACQLNTGPFKLLCHLALQAPVLTGRQRVGRVERQQTAFLNYFKREARVILRDLLEKCASAGELLFTLPNLLKLPPMSHPGNMNEFIGKFGGANQLRTADAHL